VNFFFGPPSGGTFPVAGYFARAITTPPDGLTRTRGRRSASSSDDLNKNNLIGWQGGTYLRNRPNRIGGFNATLIVLAQRVPGQLPANVGLAHVWRRDFTVGAAWTEALPEIHTRVLADRRLGMISGSPTSQTANSFGFSGAHSVDFVPCGRATEFSGRSYTPLPATPQYFVPVLYAYAHQSRPQLS